MKSRKSSLVVPLAVILSIAAIIVGAILLIMLDVEILDRGKASLDKDIDDALDVAPLFIPFLFIRRTNKKGWAGVPTAALLALVVLIFVFILFFVFYPEAIQDTNTRASESIPDIEISGLTYDTDQINNLAEEVLDNPGGIT